MDDGLDPLDVNPSGGDVRRDERAAAAAVGGFLEAVEGAQALALLHLPVHCRVRHLQDGEQGRDAADCGDCVREDERAALVVPQLRGKRERNTTRMERSEKHRTVRAQQAQQMTHRGPPQDQRRRHRESGRPRL